MRRLALYLSARHSVSIVASSESRAYTETQIHGIPLILLPYPPTSIRLRLAAIRNPRVRASDLVIESSDVGGPWFAFCARRRILLAHQLWREIFEAELRPPFGVLLKWLEPVFYLPYHRIPTCVNSPSTEESFRALGISEIRRLSIGLQLRPMDSPPIGSQTFSPIPGKTLLRRPRIAIVSRLRKYKGIDLVLKALPEVLESCPDLELLIMGRGPQRSQLEALCRSLGVFESVSFLGYVEEAKRDELLRTSFTSIAPSIREGLGLNILEAFRCGTTCIGWDVPGTRDVISDGETGILVKLGDEQGLAAGVKYLLSNPERRDAMAHAASTYSATISIPPPVEEIDQLIQGRG